MRFLGIVLHAVFCAYIGYGVAVSSAGLFALFLLVGGFFLTFMILGLTLSIITVIKRIQWNT